MISKSKRRLELWAAGKLVRTFHIAIGLDPLHDKRREGDRCTPEGSFYITRKNPKSEFYHSLSISYPNAAEAERGRKDRLISQKQYEQILRALRRGVVPPQNTPLGGKILIHGGGTQRDWTWGCVALDNRDMDVLFPLVSVGTTVQIEP